MVRQRHEMQSFQLPDAAMYSVFRGDVAVANTRFFAGAQRRSRAVCPLPSGP